MSSKKGELEVPPSFLKAFGEAKKVREIIRKTFAREELAGDQLDDLKQIIRDAGYVYTETERASDVPGIEVHSRDAWHGQRRPRSRGRDHHG